MNLNQLEYISRVAELGSFSKAAAHFGVSQPTLSNAIAQFEQEVGGAVFRRTTREVALTSFGERILPYIEQMISSKKDLSVAIDEFMNPERSVLRIGLSTMINFSLLKTLLDPYTRTNTDTEVIYKECGKAELISRLDDENIDFAFSLKNTYNKLYRSMPLYEEGLYYVESSGNMPKRRDKLSVDLDDIAEDTFALGPELCGLANFTRELFRKNGVPFKEYKGRAESYRILEQWADLGIGSVLLPKSKITNENTRALPLYDSSRKQVMLGYEVLWNKSSEKYPFIKDFVRYLRSIVPELLHGIANEV